MGIRVLFIFLLLPFVSGVNVTFIAPEQGAVQENISVQITSQTTEQHDVKIVISTGSTTLSEIFDGAWRNPFRYIKAAYPSTTLFTIRGTQPAETASLCVQLRKVNSTTYATACHSIKLTEAQVDVSLPTPSVPNEEAQEEESRQRNSSRAMAQETNKTASVSTPQFLQASLSQESSEKIMLNQPGVQHTYTSKEQLLRYAILGSFPLIVMLILVLIIYKKI